MVTITTYKEKYLVRPKIVHVHDKEVVYIHKEEKEKGKKKKNAMEEEKEAQLEDLSSKRILPISSK